MYIQSSNHRVIQERRSKLSIQMKYNYNKKNIKKTTINEDTLQNHPLEHLKNNTLSTKIISRGQEDKENKVTLKTVAYNLRIIFNKILEADETIDFKNIVKYHIDDYMLEISEEFDDIKFKLIELKKSKSITEE